MTLGLEDASELTVEGSGWRQKSPNAVTITTPQGTLLVGAFVDPNPCDAALRTAAASDPAAKLIATPAWAPKGWYSQAVSVPDAAGATLVGLCRPYKAKSLFIGVSFAGDQLTNPSLRNAALALLTQIDEAANRGGPSKGTIRFELSNNLTLDVATSSTTWTQLQPDQASTITEDGSVGVAVMFVKTSCAVALDRALAMQSTTSVAWPAWAPPWGSKAAKTIGREGLTIVNLCRPYANGAMPVVVSFYDKTFTSPRAQSSVGKLLTAIDQAASAKAAREAPAADATTEATELEGVPLTLQGPNGPYLTIRVPTGYRLMDAHITKSGDLERESVRINLYPTDVDCKAGMAARPDETLESPPAGTPKAFHDRVAVRSAAKVVSYTMCSDITGGVMIAEIFTDNRRGELTMEHAKILASVSAAAHASERAAPKQPKFVLDDLGGRTFEIPAQAGGWRQVQALGATFEYEWPRAAEAMATLNRGDSCSYAGSDSMIPSPWKAEVGTRAVRGCIDANGAKYQLAFVVDAKSLAAADRERIKQTLYALATTVYPGTAPYVAPSATVDPTTSSTTSSPEPSTSYVPTDTNDDAPRRPLRTYLYGASLGGHLFAVAGRDDTYGASLGYGRALAPRLRMQLEAGYNRESGVLFDGRLELGAFFGDQEAGGGLWAMLGVDGLGLGRDDDAMTDPSMLPPRIGADLYFGPRFELAVSSIYFGIGYAWRRDDTVDHAWRLDLGYRLESGHHLGFRYTGYGEAGHFLTMYYRY